MAGGPNCAFCGRKPRDKNREHVVPKWLLRLTDSLRDGFDVEIRRDPNRSESRRIGFASFILPACKDCNDEYARLEAASKPVMEAALRGDALSPHQISTLLDWFDKVRIGVWLWELITIGNPLGIEPKFNIGTRIRAKDRVLKIGRFRYAQPAISIACTGSLAFHYSPSSFGMMVNDVYFASISFDNLLGPWLGTAYVAAAEVDPDDLRRMRAGVAAGSGVIANPPWQDRWLLGGVCYMQPLFRFADDQMRVSVVGSPHSEEQAVDPASGIGPIFVSRNREIPRRLRLDETHDWDDGTASDFRRTQILSTAEITRFQRLFCTYFRPGNADVHDNRHYGARVESEQILLDLQRSYEGAFGLPLSICDGIVLPSRRLFQAPPGALLASLSVRSSPA